MKKSLFLTALLFAVAFIFGGCVLPEEKTDKIKIVAAAFPEYDLAHSVAGECADIKMLLKPGEEAHHFEPTPDNIRMISECDVFIYGGGESDVWLDEILDSVGENRGVIVSLMEICELLEEEEQEGMDVRGEEESEETEYDEHVWTSPLNAIKIAEGIKDVLAEKDGKNKEKYSENFKTLRAELLDIDGDFRNIASDAENKTLVFADRFPLLYFTKEYGFEYYAAFPGCSANTEPSARTLAFLIDTVNENGISVIFKTELSNDNIAFVVSEATGAEIKTFYACHNVSKTDFENGETYVSLMRKNIQTLKEALKVCH